MERRTLLPETVAVNCLNVAVSRFLANGADVAGLARSVMQDEARRIAGQYREAAKLIRKT